MNAPQPWEFTCKTCGGHQLTVTRAWKIVTGPISENWQEWGPLGPDHRWHYEFEEKIEQAADKADVMEGDYGEYAGHDSSSKLEAPEILEAQRNLGTGMFYVNCAGCDREIEFGWSQPNRGGGIYPSECSDFVPAKFWPELRYIDSWEKKGWLRTGDGLP